MANNMNFDVNAISDYAAILDQSSEQLKSLWDELKNNCINKVNGSWVGSDATAYVESALSQESNVLSVCSALTLLSKTYKIVAEKIREKEEETLRAIRESEESGGSTSGGTTSGGTTSGGSTSGGTTTGGSTSGGSTSGGSTSGGTTTGGTTTTTTAPETTTTTTAPETTTTTTAPETTTTTTTPKPAVTPKPGIVKPGTQKKPSPVNSRYTAVAVSDAGTGGNRNPNPTTYDRPSSTSTTPSSSTRSPSTAPRTVGGGGGGATRVMVRL